MNKRAFTLLELLLVVGLIAILAGIVIFAINPSKQLAETRNSQRQVDVGTISKAIYQYSIDSGLLPSSVSTTPAEICRTDASSCVGLVNLAEVTADAKYLSAIPMDPRSASANGTGYYVCQTPYGRPVVFSPEAELGQEITSGSVCGDYLLAQHVYAGAGMDIGYGIAVDERYVYASGTTNSEGQGGSDLLLIKYGRYTLDVVDKKIYGGTANESTQRLFMVDDYLYIIGGTASEGSGDVDGMILQFNKSDLSLINKKLYGGLSTDRFLGMTYDDNYLYLSGITWSDSLGSGDVILTKIERSTMNIVSSTVYGGAGEEALNEIASDENYVYGIGSTSSEGGADHNAWILKFNKSDLSLAGKMVYSGAGTEYVYGILIDGDYVYATGLTSSGGAGGRDAMLLKFNKNDLSLSAAKVYGGVSTENARTLIDNGNYLLLLAMTESEGVGSRDMLFLNVNKGDLSLDWKKVYGTSAYDQPGDVLINHGYIYFSGRGGTDFLMAKTRKELPAGTYVTDPAGYVLADSNLTWGNVTLAGQVSALSQRPLSLIYGNSNLTYTNSNLISSWFYIK